ncbi:MAG: 4'-phosphopantetheinyl transferase superfamily protein [Micropruina glycogenica]
MADRPSLVHNDTLARGVGWLDADEGARAARFVRDDDRRLFQVAHLACPRDRRGGARPATGRGRLAPGTVPRLAGSPHGRPVVVGGGVEFSVSHTRGLVAIALAAQPVGVDVEGDPTDAWPDLVGWLHPNEQREVAAATDPVVAFGRAWTRHEAHLKALGIGLGREPSLDHLGAGQQPVGSPAGFALRDLPTPAGFHGAVVTRRDPGVRPDG